MSTKQNLDIISSTSYFAGLEHQVNKKSGHRMSEPKTCVLKIFNLDFKTTDEALKEKFSEYGTPLTAKLAINRNGLSKGVATIEYQLNEEGKKAYKAMNGTEFDGRILNIEITLSKAPPPPPPEPQQRPRSPQKHSESNTSSQRPRERQDDHRIDKDRKDIRRDNRDSRDSRDNRDSRDSRDIRDNRDSREYRDNRERDWDIHDARDRPSRDRSEPRLRHDPSPPRRDRSPVRWDREISPNTRRSRDGSPRRRDDTPRKRDDSPKRDRHDIYERRRGSPRGRDSSPQRRNDRRR